MSAKKQVLISIEAVVDHDCGNYQVGELDFGIHGTLDGYIKSDPQNAMKEFNSIFGYLVYECQRRIREEMDKGNSPSQAG